MQGTRLYIYHKNTWYGPFANAQRNNENREFAVYEAWGLQRQTFKNVVDVASVVAYSLLVVEWTLNVVFVVWNTTLSYHHFRVVVVVLDPVQELSEAPWNLLQPDGTRAMEKWKDIVY